MLEIIDPVFAKTSQNARFLLSENERFGLVFVKTGSINSGTVCLVRGDFQLIIHNPVMLFLAFRSIFQLISCIIIVLINYK